MRDGPSLRGETPAQVVSLLADRVLGPPQPRRTLVVLDYHGLLINPAGTLTEVANRHHVTTRTVSNNVATVRMAGRRQPLSSPLVAEAERASTPQDDHLGRVRIASTLGLIPPEAPPPVVDKSAADGAVSGAQAAVGRAGLRVLSAIGPLTLPILAAAVARSRRFRDRNRLSDDDLTAALRVVGCSVDDEDRWHPPAGVGPSDRDRAIVSSSVGRDLTRQQMIDILITAGYSVNSAEGRMSSSHPLFERTAPNCYRLICPACSDNARVDG